VAAAAALAALPAVQAAAAAMEEVVITICLVVEAEVLVVSSMSPTFVPFSRRRPTLFLIY
jgi:hypothetical protein